MASYSRTPLTPSPGGNTRKENKEPNQTNEEMNSPGRAKTQRGESQGKTCSQQCRSRKSTAKSLEDRNLMSANIRRTHRSSVSDQLISHEQVSSALHEDRTNTGHEYKIPLPIMKPWLMENNKHGMYYDLGHCLRANIFPGMPIRACSLVEDSYTAEVNRRGIMDRNTRQHWHGRKTDDLGTAFTPSKQYCVSRDKFIIGSMNAMVLGQHVITKRCVKRPIFINQILEYLNVQFLNSNSIMC
ncbi:hypothetical protein XENTR_v10012547 [Xenopus tropicalis]|nr:hypothetical protein XENTR_v10012547 [Xenopus tropicalis]